MKNLISLLILFIFLSGCAQTPADNAMAETATPGRSTATPKTMAADDNADTAEPVVIRLMTHDSFEMSEAVKTAFEAESGITIEVFKAGDGGAALNQAILAKDNPLADVFFGVDNTFLSRALENDIFEPYASPELANIDDSLKLDPKNRALPVDFGDVCLNYDKGWFEDHNLAPPENLEMLLEATYTSLTVVENPATSTPGLAFLLATIGHFGEDAYLDYWQKLRENDVLVVNGWEDAYWGQFTAASEGERPIVVSYASSPPAEVFFAESPLDEAPTAAVVGDGACFRQIEFAGILRGTDHLTQAQQVLDFLLGQTFQEDIPLTMFVYPSNKNAALPDVFAKHSLIPTNPASVAPADIAAKREQWIEAWTETMLR